MLRNEAPGPSRKVSKYSRRCQCPPRKRLKVRGMVPAYQANRENLPQWLIKNNLVIIFNFLTRGMPYIAALLISVYKKFQVLYSCKMVLYTISFLHILVLTLNTWLWTVTECCIGKHFNKCPIYRFYWLFISIFSSCWWRMTKMHLRCCPVAGSKWPTTLACHSTSTGSSLFCQFCSPGIEVMLRCLGQSEPQLWHATLPPQVAHCFVSFSVQGSRCCSVAGVKVNDNSGMPLYLHW